MLKLIKGKIHYFVREENTLVKICPLPSVTKGDKNQEWNRRILGLPSGAGISLKAASGKEQEMVSGNTCNLSDL